MGFPYKPDVLNLTSLEDQLISPDVQTSEIVTNCQSNICTADVHNRDREKETEDEYLMFAVKTYF